MWGVAGGSRHLFGPALPHPGQKLFLVLSDLPDKRWIVRSFVPGRPEHHFREYRRKIHSFRREGVDQFSAVRWISLGGYDSMSYQLSQAIGQYVRRDSFVGFQELLVGPESPQHHVAYDQQRPAIAQDFHGSIQRTPRPPLGTRLLLWHFSTITHFNLHFTSDMAN